MDTSPMDIFNKNVRLALAAKGLTITDLADQIGMHRQELSKILNGRVDPTSGTLNRIAVGLDSPLWELLRPQQTAAKERPQQVA